jgi:CelD/BcsL family acetyltransferase involved in cellulose biosynthesis
MREQIKRYPKRLEKEFAVEYELAETEEQTQIALTDLFRLHSKRWRARGQTGVLVLPRRQKFHRELCSQLLRQGWFALVDAATKRTSVLASCCHIFTMDAIPFSLAASSRNRCAGASGRVCFRASLRRAIEEGAHEFDFLRGGGRI